MRALAQKLQSLVSTVAPTSPSPETDSDPHILPTDTPSLNAPVIPLMLLTRLGSEGDGYHQNFLLMQFTYFVEERLIENDIDVVRYNWVKRDFGPHNRTHPYDQQFYTDLFESFVDSQYDDKPILLSKEYVNHTGKTRRYFRVTGYTDLYIDNYFDHADVDRETVERHMNAFLDSLSEYPSTGSIHERLIEHDAEAFY